MFPRAKPVRYRSASSGVTKGPPRSACSTSRTMPSTCHAFTSTYELIASAARNDLLRLVVRASASSLFLVSRSKRTLTVVDFVIPLPYVRSEEHTSELQSLMRISYAVFCLKKKNKHLHHIQYYLHTSISQMTHINT